MKTILLYCFLFICLFSSMPVKAQWQQTNGPIGSGSYYDNILYADGVNFYSDEEPYGGVNLITSTDNGHNWNSIKTPNVTGIDAIAFSDSIIYLSQATTFYRSLNKGVTWTTINNGIGNPSFTALGAKDSLVFASGANGIYYSHNYGNGWSLVNTGLPTGTRAKSFIIYNSTVVFSSVNGMFYSTDFGTNWYATSITNSINVFTENNGNLYAAGDGIYESTDGGINWSSIGNLRYIGGLAVSGTNIYVSVIPQYNSDPEDVYVSSNNGANWSPFNTGLFDWGINSVASNSNGVVICINPSGIHGISGNRWTLFSGLGIKGTLISALATNDSVIYAAGSELGLFKTVDDGDTWIDIDSGIPPNTFSISVAARDNFVYACVYGKGVYRSNNYGEYWSPINSGLTDSLVLCLTVKGNILVAGSQDSGVYVSINNGDTWTKENTGLADYEITSLNTSGNEIFCSTPTSGIYKSSLNNINWLSINNGVTKFAVYPADSPFVYASSAYDDSRTDSLYRSNDFGNTWVALNIPYNLYNESTFLGQSITVKDSSVYVSGTLIPFYSTNYGQTWQFDTIGWVPDTVYCSVIKGNYLFAGTYSSSVWRELLSGVTGINSVVNKLSEIKVYPNPFNDVTTFYLPSADNQKATISVFDLLGKRIKQFETSGERNISVNLDNVCAGLYFYKVELNNGIVYTGKIIRE